MKLSNLPLVRVAAGVILGGLAGIMVSYIYGLIGAT